MNGQWKSSWEIPSPWTYFSSSFFCSFFSPPGSKCARTELSFEVQVYPTKQATTGKVDTSCSAKFKFKCRPGWSQRVSRTHRLGINSLHLSILNVLLSFRQIYHTGHYGNHTNKINVCAGENVHVLLPVNDPKTRRARGVWNTQIPRNDGRVINMKIVLLPADEKKRWLIDI